MGILSLFVLLPSTKRLFASFSGTLRGVGFSYAERERNHFELDCLQPSIFSYFYFIVECSDRITRELACQRETEDFTRYGVGTEINPIPTPRALGLLRWLFVSRALIGRHSTVFEEQPFVPLSSPPSSAVDE